MPKIKSQSPRLILNEIRWRYDLKRCTVYYIHRGAPDDTKMVTGRAIKRIDRGFLILEGDEQDVYIPYHRIFMIDYDDQTVYERSRKSDKR